MMYGRHFASMYEGSMYGAGVAVFAVWGYVISHASRGYVELNPIKLAHTLGGTVKEMESAIAFLASPDPKSRCRAHEGRRLVKDGEYQYMLPSWDTYERIRNESERKVYNREAKRKERQAKQSKCSPGYLARERRAAEAYGDGEGDKGDSISAEGLPDRLPGDDEQPPAVAA